MTSERRQLHRAFALRLVNLEHYRYRLPNPQDNRDSYPLADYQSTPKLNCAALMLVEKFQPPSLLEVSL